jgi:hypothetical protein
VNFPVEIPVRGHASILPGVLGHRQRLVVSIAMTSPFLGPMGSCC